MKKLTIVSMVAAAAVLAGCAAPGPRYATAGYAQPVDPNGWRVVSVTPVPVGTGARAAANGQDGVTSTPLPTTTYSAPAQQPVYVQQQPVYVQQQPVYVQQQPVYVPQPVYVEQPRYWYPPISIGLGFDFGRSSWRGHRGRGWGGHVGTRWPY